MFMSKLLSYARGTLIVFLMVAIATIAVPYDNALSGGNWGGGAQLGPQVEGNQNTRVSAIGTRLPPLQPVLRHLRPATYLSKKTSLMVLPGRSPSRW